MSPALTPPTGCYWQRFDGALAALSRRLRYIVDIDDQHFAFTERRASRRFYRVAERSCARSAGWFDRGLRS